MCHMCPAECPDCVYIDKYIKDRSTFTGQRRERWVVEHCEKCQDEYGSIHVTRRFVGYCFTCKSQVLVDNGIETVLTTKRGPRIASTGLCTHCSTKVFRMGALEINF